METKLTPVIEQSFTQYAAAVAQSRALVDVRDCIKPSARQIFYSMLRNKYTWDKPHEKTNAPLGDAQKEFYIHGDASCIGIMMRASQPFSMRYPLCDCKGNAGTLMASGNYAAPRYTSTRLAEPCAYLFADIQKDTIEEWRDNYADNLQYPAVLPSKGFYNIVNGSTGIATGLASNIPQFNITELNEVLIKLLWNENISDDEIVIMPDFATGAILLNSEQVKESLLKGRGSACKLRSVIDYDSKERVLTVREIPYGVYTNTICGQLEEILNGNDNPGIDRFNDLTDKSPKIKIYLSKGASPEKILKYLYKNTSLQSHYGINLTMLDQGRYPKVFTWREALLAHLSHEKQVYVRGFNYDLRKINERLHIIEGLLKAISMIDEVVRTIKASSDTRNANLALQKLLNIDEVQAKAILEIKLSRLAHLEVDKLLKEKGNLEQEQKRITSILNDETLLKKEIENGLREVIKKFGDARRTQILNLNTTKEDEIIESKQLIISLTNYSNLKVEETSTLIVQKRGRRGAKVPLNDGECIIDTITESNTGTLMMFSNKGRYYSLPINRLNTQSTQSIYDLIKLQEDEQITRIISYSSADEYKYVLFITKLGLIKKSLLSEYKAKTSAGARGIKLKDDDELVSICFLNNEPVGILTKYGQYAIINTENINPQGKIASGVVGVKLSSGDEVTSAKAVLSSYKILVSISKLGQIAKVNLTDCPILNRGVKGYKIQKRQEEDYLQDFVLLEEDCELIAVTNTCALKFNSSDVTEHERGTVGVKGIKLKPQDFVRTLLKN